MAKFELEDFGPLAAASVELKPLTVFFGPNNSGKSYLALAIYSLWRTLAGESPVPGLRRLRGSRHLGLELDSGKLEEIRKLLKKGRGRESIQLAALQRSDEWPSPIQEVFDDAQKKFTQVLASDFGGELQRCFGTPIVQLGRRTSSVVQPRFRVSFSGPEHNFKWEVESTSDSLLTKTWSPFLSPRELLSTRPAPPISFLREEPETFLGYIVPNALARLAGGLVSSAYYLPASRSGILLGHKTFVNLIVGRSSLAWLEPMEIPKLPGVVTDLIQALLDLGKSRFTPSQTPEVASFLESEVTKGTVTLDNSLEYPEIYYENLSGKFAFHQASSMVSEMAPLVLFLRYLVRPGDLFIIEEPESHLDPENQRNLARAIARLVNSKVRIIITTHSDFFINQLNNLILASQLRPARRAKTPYASEELLRPALIGAYLFAPSPDGTRVQELEVNGSDGIPTDQFTRVHAEVYNEAITFEKR